MKRPFVVTVALASIAGACGGSTVATVGDGGACPASLPTNGAACAPTGTSCSYPTDPNGCCPPAGASCVQGAWQTQISTCNPPAPQCPKDPPVDGSTCASPDPCAVKSYTCTWGDCAASSSVVGNCDGTRWTTAVCTPGK